MFFLLRSACCIALVVSALPDRGAPSPRSMTPRLASTALTGVAHLCQAAPTRCSRLLAAGLQAGSAEAFAALASQGSAGSSRDTLSDADRRPAWTGPVIVAAD